MIIPHSIPTIGKVKIDLQGYPERIYQILFNFKEVERLRNLLHLGVLQDSFPGMNHTRWDYTLTTLYFIRLFGEAKFKGLSRTARISGIEISGRDMMQVMALLSNTGHLPGTFSVEKGALRFLISRNLVTDLLKKAKIDPSVNINYLNINKVFAIIKLREWLNNVRQRDIQLLTAAISLLSELVSSNAKTEHRKEIFDLFNMTRRISYQIVDCLYVNLPIRINYAEFATEIFKFSESFSHWEPMQGLMDDYTRIVYQQIYHLESTHESVADISDAAFKKLESSIDPIGDICDLWLKSAFLKDIKIVGTEKKYTNLLSASLPHKFGPSFMSDRLLEDKVDYIESDYLKAVPTARMLILYIPGLKDPISGNSTAGDLSLDVFVDKDLSLVDCMKTSGLTLAWFIHKYGGNWGSGIIIKSFIENIMRRAAGVDNLSTYIDICPTDFFKDELISYGFVPEDQIKSFRTLQRKDAISMFRRKGDTNWDSTKKDRFYEVCMLKEVALRRWLPKRERVTQSIIIIPGRIKFQKEKRDVCEFDGSLLTLVSKRRKLYEMKLFFLEAKSGKTTGKNVSNKQIKDKFDRLGGLYKSGRIFNLKYRSAYGMVDLLQHAR